MIADVYNGVRSSPLWEKILLLILHDEHGGTYDHIRPPAATPPDDYNSQFAFDRYGPRVPAVLISPFVPKGTIDHEAYDHTSIPATLKKIFGLPSFLTRRDAAAQTFSAIASLDTARTDTPASIPKPAKQEMQPSVLPFTGDPTVPHGAGKPISNAPLSDFQQGLVALAHTLELQESPELKTLRLSRRIDTEHDGAVYVREVAERYAQTSAKGGRQ